MFPLLGFFQLLEWSWLMLLSFWQISLLLLIIAIIGLILALRYKPKLKFKRFLICIYPLPFHIIICFIGVIYFNTGNFSIANFVNLFLGAINLLYLIVGIFYARGFRTLFISSSLLIFLITLFSIFMAGMSISNSWL